MPQVAPELAQLLARFGHERFRPGQERVIRALLAGHDVLALLPTGAGKSLVYQLTAQLLPSATVVVTPLIALMKNQIESLKAAGMPAVDLSGSLSQGTLDSARGALESGGARLLFDSVGYKTLLAQLVVEGGLLERAG